MLFTCVQVLGSVKIVAQVAKVFAHKIPCLLGCLMYKDIIQIEFDPPPSHPIFGKVLIMLTLEFLQKLGQFRLWIYILNYPSYFLRVPCLGQIES